MIDIEYLLKKVRDRAKEAEEGQLVALKGSLGAVHPYEAVQQAYGVMAGQALAYQDLEQILIKLREDEEE